MTSLLQAQADLSAGRSNEDAGAVPWVARIALAAGFLFAWIVRHSYFGVIHDSQLYTLPALVRLHPELLANDIMLRLGSQDSFTVFSPLFAAAIRLFGIDHAAVTITLVWQILFFAAAFVFARRLMPERLAWLTLGLVCVVPGFYGSNTVFTIVEDFATPRLISEALVLVGLTCFIDRRYLAAGLIGLVSASLHPLMTAAGIAVAIFMAPVSTRTKAWIIVGATFAGMMMLGVLAARGAQLVLDEAWLHLLENGTRYLFVKSWTVGSFSRASVMLGTLLVGLMVLEKSPARSLCGAAFLAALAGTAASFVGGDLLHLVPVVQVQLWRWNWIANLFAILFLPLIVAHAWSKGGLWRAAALLLGVAWLCIPEVYGLEVMAVTLVLCLVARKGIAVRPQVERQILFGACAFAVLAVVYHIATSILYANAVPDQSDVPAWLQRLRALARSGALPFAAFAALATIMFRVRVTPLKVAAAACSVLALAILLPLVSREWTREAYTGQIFEAFAPWRAQIPVGTEVLWFDSPVASWLLLQRPSYLSNQQESSGLFSRPAAMAMKDRLNRLAPFLESEDSVGWREPGDSANRRKDLQVPLSELCAAATDVKFVVTQKNVFATPIATTPPGVSNRYKGVQLYRCPGSEG